jgi:hypothetical protein
MPPQSQLPFTITFLPIGYNVPALSCRRQSAPWRDAWRRQEQRPRAKRGAAAHGQGRAKAGRLARRLQRIGRLPHTSMCKILHMATNLAIDDALLEEARRIGGQKTKRATVTQALNEYIQRRKQQRVVELFGKIDVDPKFDYKVQRRRR